MTDRAGKRDLHFVPPATDTCGYCARRKRLDAAGLVVRHLLTIDVSRRAIPAVGAGRVRRVCGGSGRPPREATR